MILKRDVGEISEPLSGRAWSGGTVRRECAARARAYAARGVGPDDLVLLHHGNTLEFFADLLALWSLGACAAPLDPRFTAFEVETVARAARARFSLWGAAPAGDIATGLEAQGVVLLESLRGESAEAGGGAEPPRPPAWRETGRDALVLFTSGSTGEPKGVVHTHGSLLARWSSLRAPLGLEATRRTLCLLPTHFGHGLICNALYPWLSGQRLAILPPFRPDVILQLGQLLDAEGITFMSSVPALWRLALRTARPPAARTLERVFCGSAPLSAAMWRDIAQWSGGARVGNVYGITETASWLAGTAPDTVPEDGLVGEAWGGTIAIGGDGAPGRDTPAGEEGPIRVRTPALMRGYLRREDLTAAVVHDGWLATGDVGALDDRGRLHLRGREREEINRGGMKVYPSDVDAILERFDLALDACAFGYDDGQGQEEVGAAVVLRSAGPPDLARLHAWTRAHLAAHQMPRRWYVVDEIPRTSRGKVSRAQVAARCAALPPVDLRRLGAGDSGGA